MQEITVTNTTLVTSIPASIPAELGVVANYHAAQAAFDDYRSRKASNTLKAHGFDLTDFAKYLGLASVFVDAGQLGSDPDAWRGLTWGLVEGYVKWMLTQGYAIGTLNRRLSTVKIYAKLAAKAGAISTQEHAMIRLVTGYAGKEQKRVDEKRAKTRMGTKKAQNVALTAEQAKALKTQPDTPQGRRDAVIMTLLLDLGLRVGELHILQVDSFKLKTGKITIYRPKVDLTQTHDLSKDCLLALRNWVDSGDCAPFGPLLRGSKKNQLLTDCGMSTTSITERVRTLGEAIGVHGLSAHDCRHYWATHHANKGTPVHRLMQAGGWKTPTMPMRYIDASKIANEGMV